MTTAAPSKGASILAALTADVMREKQTEARKLTPVAGEARPDALPKPKVMFPNDNPTEVVAGKAAELTRIIDHLTQARDALLTLVEAPLPSEVIDPAVALREKERAADEALRAKVEAFPEEYAAKVADTKAAVFKEPVAALPGGEWLCPTHDKPAIEKVSEKTGKTYLGCPDCNSFPR